MAVVKNLIIPLMIRQGETFRDVLRWETDPIVRKAITGIDLSTGCPRLTVTAHGLIDGWRGMVYGVKQPKEINAEDTDPEKARNYTQGTVIDANTVELNKLSADGWKAYTEGGILQYNTPHDLTGYFCRMSIKAKPNTDPILLKCSVGGVASSTKPAGPGSDGTVTWVATTTATDSTTKEWLAGATYSIGDVIDLTDLMFLCAGNGRLTVDTATKTIQRTISALDTAAISWKTAYYDREMVSPAGVVTRIDAGSITVSKERTT